MITRGAVFLCYSQSDIDSVKDLLCWSESQVSWSALWSSVFEQCVGGREGQGHLQICLGTTGNNICAHLEMFTKHFFVKLPETFDKQVETVHKQVEPVDKRLKQQQEQTVDKQVETVDKQVEPVDKRLKQLTSRLL